MGNVSIKRVCLDTIANYIAANVTGLAGKVSAVAAGPEVIAPCLAVKLISDSFTFEPNQEEEIYELDSTGNTSDGKVVVDVGSFTGIVTLQLYAANVPERELYEQRILDLFLKTVWAPGTIFATTPNLTINGYSSLYQAELKARIDGDEWSEEFSFESRRYSFIDLYVDFPALTTYDAANLTSLQLALAKTTDTIATIADVDPAYRVAVQADGSTIKGTV